jgi:deoxyribodipyrimidine photo-lyase
MLANVGDRARKIRVRHRWHRNQEVMRKILTFHNFDCNGIVAQKTALVWFRRDLRTHDNTALAHALAENDLVHCAFIFDTAILEGLKNRADRRVEFIWESVCELDASLRAHGGGLIVRHALAQEEIPALAKSLGVQTVYANHDYEPSAITRDATAHAGLSNCGAELKTFKDQVVFEKSEVMTLGNTPFSVFTPYKNAWLKKLTEVDLNFSNFAPKSGHIAPQVLAIPSLEAMGFTRTNLAALKVPTGMRGGKKLFEDFLTRIDHYDESRNFPSIKGPSYLSVHLRFGTVSIRELASAALARWRETQSDGAGTWLSELIWRDFYFQILHHHPRVVERAFKPEYDAVEWVNNPQHFDAWCAGKTGYPIVDAGMRQLNETGYMHNRLRMVVASFLTKDLQIDWRWGERYFAEQLIDYDMSANTGGWQWAASTGCDSQPYFRIFNPTAQSEKFDAKGAFIRRYIPEIAALSDKEIHAPWLCSEMILNARDIVLGKTYPHPIVDHASARDATLAMFKAIRN